MVWAAKLFRPYLLGHAWNVITDHAACTSLSKFSKSIFKLAHWAMVIQELDLTITRCSGKSNHVADALSKSPFSPVEVLQVETTSVDTSAPPAESDIVTAASGCRIHNYFSVLGEWKCTGGSVIGLLSESETNQL